MKKAAARQGKPVPFHKLHGAGNDILVVQSKNLPTRNKPEFMRRIGHRQFGVGADQIIEVKSTKPLAIQIWNQDGSQAEMCANGARVVLFLAAQKGWISAKAKEVPIKISGKKYTGVKGDGGYEINLGEPEIEGAHTLWLGEQSIPLKKVSTGNPHAVIMLGVSAGEWNAPATYNFRETGARIETHPDFPKRTNVEFVRQWAKEGSHVKAIVDVWERGAGATLSCGSGAVAVAAVLRSLTGADTFEIAMTSYVLNVRFGAKGAYLSGPVAPVAEGLFFS